MSVAARCRNAIDYTKPISPLVEELILDQLETEKLMQDAWLKGSTVVDTDGNRLGVLKSSIEKLSAEFMPWLELMSQQNDPQSAMKNKAEAWEKMFGNKK